MHTALNVPIVPFASALLLLSAAACHNEPDCGGEVMPAGVELEVLPTRVISDVGCDGLGATLDDEPRIFTTGEPVDIGAHSKCLIESLASPEVQELYGVRIDFCRGQSVGVTCQGHLISCAEQTAHVEVSLLFNDVRSAGIQSTRLYGVSISADAKGDCPPVRCEQEFEARTTRL